MSKSYVRGTTLSSDTTTQKISVGVRLMTLWYDKYVKDNAFDLPLE